jgi:hypothetical protein
MSNIPSLILDDEAMDDTIFLGGRNDISIYRSIDLYRLYIDGCIGYHRYLYQSINQSLYMRRQVYGTFQVRIEATSRLSPQLQQRLQVARVMVVSTFGLFRRGSFSCSSMSTSAVVSRKFFLIL